MLGRWDISSRGALVRVLVSAAVLFHGPSCSSIRAGSICAGVLSPLSLRISKCRLSSLENPACGDGPGEEGVSSVISIGEVHGSRLWRAGSWGLSSPPRRLSPSLPPPRPIPASESDPLERSELLVQEGSPGLGGPHLAFCIPTSPWTVCACSATSVVPNSATPWTAARQAALSMGVSRQESWSGLPCPPPGDLPDPGIKPVSPVSRCTWEVSVNSKLHPEPSS